MKTSTRLLASLAALLAAVTVSTLASGASAMAAPGTIPPITTLVTPQLKVAVLHNLIQPGGFQTFTVTGKYSDGSALVGKIVVTIDHHDGTGPAVFYTATNLPPFVGGETDPITASPLGDTTVTATFSAVAYQQGAKASVDFQVRALGPSLAVATGSAVAGVSTTVKTTVTVPFGGHPIDGRVGVQIDGLGEKASCLPTAVSATVASCTANLPASLSAGPHALTVIWADSPSFVTANYATTFTIAKAPVKAPAKAPASGSTAGSSTGSGTTVTPSPIPATPTAAPTPQATAIAGAERTAPTAAPSAQALPATPASSTVPLWAGIAVAILLIAFLTIAALVTVAIVRSRKARSAA